MVLPLRLASLQHTDRYKKRLLCHHEFVPLTASPRLDHSYERRVKRKCLKEDVTTKSMEMQWPMNIAFPESSDGSTQLSDVVFRLAMGTR